MLHLLRRINNRSVIQLTTTCITTNWTTFLKETYQRSSFCLSYRSSFIGSVCSHSQTLSLDLQRGIFSTKETSIHLHQSFLTSCLKWLKHFLSYFDVLDMADNKYLTGYAKLGTSSCKKCKQKIDKGALRIAKLTTNPFSDEGGEMRQWYHPQCMFETFLRARATTKKIEEPDDVEGFTDLDQEDKERLLKLMKGITNVLKYRDMKRALIFHFSQMEN